MELLSDAAGLIIQRGKWTLSRTENLVSGRHSVCMPEGQIFYSVTYGKGQMGFLVNYQQSQMLEK